MCKFAYKFPSDYMYTEDDPIFDGVEFEPLNPVTILKNNNANNIGRNL